MAVELGAQQSPYTSIQGRSVKALSEDATRDYLNGAGAGLALAAELNGYPGPKHILELADELSLTQPQRAAVTRVFDGMREKAVKLGTEVVEAETLLDAAFRQKTIEPKRLAELTAKIAALQGELRYTHLVAHLESKRILTPGQQLEYARLRGYTDKGGEHHQHRHH